LYRERVANERLLLFCLSEEKVREEFANKKNEKLAVSIHGVHQYTRSQVVPQWDYVESP
jgi:inorganic pyrophosphatase/exopolyphosphatase